MAANKKTYTARDFSTLVLLRGASFELLYLALIGESCPQGLQAYLLAN